MMASTRRRRRACLLSIPLGLLAPMMATVKPAHAQMQRVSGPVFVDGQARVVEAFADSTRWPEPGTELTVDLEGTWLELPVVGGAGALSRAVR